MMQRNWSVEVTSAASQLMGHRRLSLFAGRRSCRTLLARVPATGSAPSHEDKNRASHNRDRKRRHRKVNFNVHSIIARHLRQNQSFDWTRPRRFGRGRSDGGANGSAAPFPLMETPPPRAVSFWRERGWVLTRDGNTNVCLHGIARRPLSLFSRQSERAGHDYPRQAYGCHCDTLGRYFAFVRQRPGRISRRCWDRVRLWRSGL